MPKTLEFADIRPIDVEMLPHERCRLTELYQAIVDEQAGNAEEFNKAIEESSETFHDNAPMEAVRDHQNFYTYPRAKEVMRLSSNAIIRPYPEVDTEIVQPGTVVDILWGDEIERFAIIYLKLAETAYPSEDITGISVESGLGQLLVGSSMGSVVGEINGIEQTIEVVAIEQALLSEFFESRYDFSDLKISEHS